MTLNPYTNSAGKLIALEGIDDVGKTTIAKQLVDKLEASGKQATYVSFPDRNTNSLGKWVYDFHHTELANKLTTEPCESIQLLHIAAHIDVIVNRILPDLKKGSHVILDRYWWSTWAYGKALGISTQAINAMLEIENEQWRAIRPFSLFLITRKRDSAPTPTERLLTAEYAWLAKNESKKYNIHRIRNNGTLEGTINRILEKLTPPTKAKRIKPASETKRSIDPTSNLFPKTQIFTKLSPAKTTKVYDTYWNFAAKRQRVFFDRLSGRKWPWTDDPILRDYKFTNAYRASDRVSQYLIRNVIYKFDQSPKELFFRILLFKVFNRIETWELLQRELGEISYANYNFDRYNSILTSSMAKGERVYSAAYIMPSGGSKNPGLKKHSMHLSLIDQMIKDNLPNRIAEMRRMSKAFELIRSYPTIGDFLAYQYVTDLNYSTLTNFSEMEFVVPGPGALGGIRKCFSDLGGLNESEIIRVVTDRQEQEFADRGLDFESLWGRPLQLIDCQNLFCETDKYARVRHPEFNGDGGRSRIKQKYKGNTSRLSLWYPPKWELNEKIQLETHV